MWRRGTRECHMAWNPRPFTVDWVGPSNSSPLPHTQKRRTPLSPCSSVGGLYSVIQLFNSNSFSHSSISTGRKTNQRKSIQLTSIRPCFYSLNHLLELYGLPFSDHFFVKKLEFLFCSNGFKFLQLNKSFNSTSFKNPFSDFGTEGFFR